MKKLIASFAISIIFFACTENNNIVDPLDQHSGSSSQTIQQLPKNVTWLSMPSTKGDIFIGNEQAEGQQKIDLKKGGTVTASWHKRGGKEINAELIVPVGAKKDLNSLDFYMLVDNDNLSIKFEPHPTFFDIPLTLNLEFKGIDLTGIDPKEICFAYLDDPATGFVITNDQITIDVKDVKKATISISNIQIPHFSEYGFVRRTGD
ncbi:MAG: hypothetical protein NTX65_03325 [Ignavibacteriales bacterium]|nr:hypothetical protein [Ignavibacteriales bacterium]